MGCTFRQKKKRNLGNKYLLYINLYIVYEIKVMPGTDNGRILLKNMQQRSSM